MSTSICHHKSCTYGDRQVPTTKCIVLHYSFIVRLILKKLSKVPYLASLLNCSYCLHITSGDNIHTFLLLQHNNHHYNLSSITNMLQSPGISVEVITVICILAIYFRSCKNCEKQVKHNNIPARKSQKLCLFVYLQRMTSACTDMHNYHTKSFLKPVKKT